MWTRPNNWPEIVDDYGEWKDRFTKWCDGCDEHTHLIDTDAEPDFEAARRRWYDEEEFIDLDKKEIEDMTLATALSYFSEEAANKKDAYLTKADQLILDATKGANE